METQNVESQKTTHPQYEQTIVNEKRENRYSVNKKKNLIIQKDTLPSLRK